MPNFAPIGPPIHAPGPVSIKPPTLGGVGLNPSVGGVSGIPSFGGPKSKTRFTIIGPPVRRKISSGPPIPLTVIFSTVSAQRSFGKPFASGLVSSNPVEQQQIIAGVSPATAKKSGFRLYGPPVKLPPVNGIAEGLFSAWSLQTPSG